MGNIPEVGQRVQLEFTGQDIGNGGDYVVAAVKKRGRGYYVLLEGTENGNVRRMRLKDFNKSLVATQA